jgi:hypothetical protein
VLALIAYAETLLDSLLATYVNLPDGSTATAAGALPVAKLAAQAGAIANKKSASTAAGVNLTRTKRYSPRCASPSRAQDCDGARLFGLAVSCLPPTL